MLPYTLGAHSQFLEGRQLVKVVRGGGGSGAQSNVQVERNETALLVLEEAW